MKKKLLFITGTRADYGKIKPLALAAQKVGFDIEFFITGMHLFEEYGLTKIEVMCFPDAKFHEFLNQRKGDPQDIVLIKTIQGFSDHLRENPVDMVLIHGDRVEAIAGTLVCATNNQFCAHIEGGEVSGSIDEMFRHCNTKLSSIHFTSSDKASKRLIALGEEPNRIFNIGSPELDFHAVDYSVSIHDIKKHYGINFQDFGICVFHPVTTEIDLIKKQSEVLFTALEKTRKPFIVIKPNNDPGCEEIHEKIQGLDPDNFKIIPSMRFEYFSKLLKSAQLIIGNSSVGVREAPFLGLASINYGSRQSNRSNYQSIIHYNGDSEDHLKTIINKHWGEKFERSMEFGDGNACDKFVNALTDKTLWELNIQKYFYDHSSL